MRQESPRARIRIVAVRGRRERARFLALPGALYGDDPVWIAPLWLERRLHLSSRNPFLEHASAALFLAQRGDRTVGRISAQIDRLHLAQHGDEAGFFGLLEAEDDEATFRELFSAAEGWLRERGMRRALGPFSFSINQECGLLVSGFETPPQVMMPHGRPYYPRHVEACGYAPAKDLLAYRIPVETGRQNPFLGRRAGGSLTLRPLSKAHLKRDLAIVRELFNDAWSGNWGFVSFTDRELDELGSLLKYVVPSEFVWFAERAGEPLGFIVVLPNLNEAIADLEGRLLPLGWAKLLWRLLVRSPRTARLALLGLRSDLQGSLAGAPVIFRLIGALDLPFARRGVEELELSWILEDNLPMRSVITHFGAELYKRYRIYTRELP